MGFWWIPPCLKKGSGCASLQEGLSAEGPNCDMGLVPPGEPWGLEESEQVPHHLQVIPAS